MSDNREWAKQLIAYYEQGYSDAEVAAEMKVTLREFYSQLNENAAFAKLVEFGRTLSQAFWEKQARLHLTNKSFNASVYSFYMKNKYGWAEKVESKNDDFTASSDLDSLRSQVMNEVRKLLKKNSPEMKEAQQLFADLGNFNEQVPAIRE